MKYFVVAPRYFLLEPIKKFSLQNREKIGSAGFCALGLMKMPMCTCTWATSMPCCCCLFLFFIFFVRLMF